MNLQHFLDRLPGMYKAVAACISLLVPFLTAIGSSLADGSVTSDEWVLILTAFAALIGGTRAVWQVKNR